MLWAMDDEDLPKDGFERMITRPWVILLILELQYQAAKYLHHAGWF